MAEYKGIVISKPNTDVTNLTKKDILYCSEFPTLKLVDSGSGSISYSNVASVGGSFSEVIGTYESLLGYDPFIVAYAEYFDIYSDASTSYQYLMPIAYGVIEPDNGTFSIDYDNTTGQVIFSGSIQDSSGYTTNQTVTLNYSYYLYYDPIAL